MSASDAFHVEMRRLLGDRSQVDPLPLDDQTVERLLAGLAAADAPPGYARAAEALAALDQDPRSWELVGESEAVPTIATVVASTQPESRRRFPVLTKLRSAKVAAGTVVGVLSLTTGLAMAGALPGAAQDVASNVLAKVGVSTPTPNSHAGNHPNTRGNSADHNTSAPDPTKGSQISSLATSTDLTGVAKGAAISILASGGQSQAGQHGNAPASVPPVNAPNGGGTNTANQASNGASNAGTPTANQASGGASSAGSGNASNGQSHRP